MAHSLIAPTRRVLAIVLAGGKGERLYPLTHERSKPAVPFGGKYRIIDFVLSNCVNSGMQSIYILVQYMSQSLIEYLRTSWRTAGLTRDQFITVVPPQMRLGTMWYRGTADAVRQNLNLIHDFDPDIVAVFGSDHVYRMDIAQMLRFHVEKGADITVATIPAPAKHSTLYGVVEVDSRNRVKGFSEKPKVPKTIPGDSAHILASMGNYLFNRDALVSILRHPDYSQPDLDFGHSILPNIHRKMKTYAYDLSTNVLPGIRSYEEAGYWRDVGTIAAFYESNMDILDPRPRLNLNNRKWPIHSGRYDGPPAKIIGGKLTNCIIGDGCLIRNATVHNSIIGRGVHLHDGAVITDSIIMDHCKIRSEARLTRVIVDRFNEIAAREIIGGNPARDARKYFVDSSGLTVVPRAATLPR